MTLPERIATIIAYLIVGSVLGLSIAVVGLGFWIGVLQ